MLQKVKDKYCKERAAEYYLKKQKNAIRKVKQ